MSQKGVKSSCFKIYIDSVFKITLKENLFSNTGFHLSNNFLQAKIKVRSMFSSLSHSFPVVSNLVSRKKMIESRKKKETEKGREKQL